MNIGIDARELANEPTGVGRYLAGLLAAWRSGGVSARHRLTLFAPKPLATEATSGFEQQAVPGSSGTWWEQVTLPPVLRESGLDVWFAPAYTAPVSIRLPVVLTVHDLSYVSHPEWFRAREGLRRRLITRIAARRAAAVLTDSACSRQEILASFGLPESRVHVVYPGLTSVVEPGPSGRDGEPLVLFAGSIFNRRHVPDLIRHFRLVARTVAGARLVIVGSNRTYPHEDLAAVVAETGLDNCVEWRAYAPEAELAALYRRARVFVFPSEYEGFGLPPLEALGAGVPVVVADTPVAREICGPAAQFVAVGDGPGWSHAIIRLLTDRDARARIVAAAPAVLARYRWDEAARATLAVIEAAGREPVR